MQGSFTDTKSEIESLINQLNSQEVSTRHGFCLIEGALAAPRLWYADPVGGNVVPFPGADETYEGILACLKRIADGEEPSHFRHALLRAEVDAYNEEHESNYVVVSGAQEMAIVDLSGNPDHQALATYNARAARLWWRLLAATQKS
jgi:hypothetical protein